MNKARGMICWHDYDGVKKRACDTGDGPNFQCPNPAKILLIKEDGDVEYACGDGCLNILRGELDDSLFPVKLMGTTPTGFQVWCYSEGGKL